MNAGEATTPGTTAVGHARPVGRRPRIAAIAQEYFKGSHADKLVSKLFRGHELMWVPRKPALDIASIYIEHHLPNDIGVGLAAEHGSRVATSIRDALIVDGKLAVDGVVIVGDQHPGGGRPDSRDDRGQPLDPRARYFAEVAEVVRETGQPVPVFIDKQLGCTWEEAQGVYNLARELGIPLMAGSSIPVNYRFPNIQIPLESTVEEVVVAASGSGETNPYHMLEVVESMIERRKGFETGVATVRFLSGAELWRTWESGTAWSRAVQEAAIGASPHAEQSPQEFYAEHPTDYGDHPADRLPQLKSAGEAILVEYRDGVRLAMLLLNGYMLRRNVAVKIAELESPLVTSSPTGGKLTSVPMSGPFLPPADHPKPGEWNFDHLSHFVEDFIATGEAPYPVERTLLVGGILDAAMTSRYNHGAVVETPHLDISYKPAAR